MRIIAFILSLYIFALNIYVCEHEDKSVKDTHFVSISQDSQHEHHQDTEPCSPFCYDDCQIVITLDTAVFISLAPVVHSYQKDFYYQESLGFDFTSNLLQPPRA